MLKPVFTQLFLGAVLTCCESGTNTTLDGRSFYIDTYHNSQYYSSETLVFSSGTMYGTESVRYGFQPAVYVLDKKGRLQCSMYSATNGVLDWDGKLRDNSIAGTIIWSRDSQETVQYTFNGKEK